jgi:hypothetical protein
VNRRAAPPAGCARRGAARLHASARDAVGPLSAAQPGPLVALHPRAAASQRRPDPLFFDSHNLDCGRVNTLPPLPLNELSPTREYYCLRRSRSATTSRPRGWWRARRPPRARAPPRARRPRRRPRRAGGRPRAAPCPPARRAGRGGARSAPCPGGTGGVVEEAAVERAHDLEAQDRATAPVPPVAGAAGAALLRGSARRAGDDAARLDRGVEQRRERGREDRAQRSASTSARAKSAARRTIARRRRRRRRRQRLRPRPRPRARRARGAL